MSTQNSNKFEKYFKNEDVYKNKHFNMDAALKLSSGLKYCVKCKENMDYCSKANYEIKSAEGNILLYLSSRKFLMHCSGGCSWTCDKLKYCPRCGHKLDTEKDCNCNKWATDDEVYLWNDFINDLLNDESFLKSLN